MNTRRTSRPLTLVLIGIAALSAMCFAVPAHAEGTSAPPAPAPAATAPAAPSAPEQQPGDTTPPVTAPKKKDEEETAAGGNNTQPAPRAGLGTRVSAVLSTLRGQGAVVSQLADRDRIITDLRSQLAKATGSVTSLTTERDTLRNELNQIESAMRTLEGERRDVAETVASLGFDPKKLPAQNSGDAPEKKAHEVSSEEANLAALNKAFGSN